MLPIWVKITVAVLSLAVLVTIWAELSGIIILRKTEDMAGSINAKTILWVGNSDIFVGKLPKQLQTVAGAYGFKTNYKDLSKHSNRGGSLRGLKESAIGELQSGKYDYVVLLDDPWLIRDNIEEFLGNVRYYCVEARENGVIPVLFNAAWAAANRKPDEARLSVTTEACKQAAFENDIILVNATDAWIYAYQSLPEISLFTRFDPRGPHPSKAGGFLTACVFAAALFDIHVEDIPKDNLYKGNDAIDIANAAWEFVRSSP